MSPEQNSPAPQQPPATPAPAEPQPNPMPPSTQPQPTSTPPPPPQTSSLSIDPNHPYANMHIDQPDPDERVLAIVHRHPIGLVTIYLQNGLAFAIGIAVLYATFHYFGAQITDQMTKIILLLAVAIGGVMALFLMLATYIYRQSKLIITDKTITQIIQRSLFSRKVSQLSLADVEDVNSDTRGLLQTMFKFGSLNVETAGQVENFNFKLCPESNYCAKMVLEARKQFVNVKTE